MNVVNASVLRVENVRLNRGERCVLDGVSFEADRGELMAIMGQSGSGKTTLLRAIAGLEPFTSGRIAVDGVTLEGGLPSARTRRALCRKVGLVFQFHCLFEHMSALDNICLAPVHAYGVTAGEAERRARDLLRGLGVEHRSGALPKHLSGGEAQRVAIARALAVDPPVLLMDEPTASLDSARRAELGGLMRGLVAEGRTLVVATHDEEFARAWATRLVRLDDGKVARSSLSPDPATT
jgi:ABC-type polar amino acid transport system ATPase subunit